MTDNEKKLALNLRKLVKAGIVPRGYDYGVDKERRLVDFDKIPFSNYFNTYAEFLKAHDKLLDDASEGKDLDDTILFKVSKTIEELEISN